MEWSRKQGEKKGNEKKRKEKRTRAATNRTCMDGKEKKEGDDDETNGAG